MLIMCQVVIQVFPDEFHLHTLDQFLSATARLHPQVNVKDIVTGLMNRLSAYAAREADAITPEQKQKSEEEATLKLLEQIQISKDKAPSENGENGDSADTDADSLATTAVEPEETAAASASSDGTGKGVRGIPDDIKLFEIFNEQVQSLVKLQRLPLWDSVALMVALSNLALNIYPDRLDYVDQVLAFAREKVSQYVNSADLHSQASQSQIVALLLAPVKSYFSIFTALALPNFIPLLHAQPYPSRRAIAGEIVRTILQNQIKIDSEDGLKAVLEVLRVVIKEGTQQTSGYPGGPLQKKGQETDETIEEQGWIARMVHLLQSPSNDTQFKVSLVLRYACPIY
jgi:vacuolar protein sorting-associated protein 35